MKLYYYSNLSGNSNWARNPEHFRQLEGLKPNALAVRAAHKGIEPLPGYHKTSGELANDPIVTVQAPPKKAGRRYKPINLTDIIGPQDNFVGGI